MEGVDFFVVTLGMRKINFRSFFHEIKLDVIEVCYETFEVPINSEHSRLSDAKTRMKHTHKSGDKLRHYILHTLLRAP